MMGLMIVGDHQQKKNSRYHYNESRVRCYWVNTCRQLYKSIYCADRTVNLDEGLDFGYFCRYI
jgi:hypothetical protein